MGGGGERRREREGGGGRLCKGIRSGSLEKAGRVKGEARITMLEFVS